MIRTRRKGSVSSVTLVVALVLSAGQALGDGAAGDSNPETYLPALNNHLDQVQRFLERGKWLQDPTPDQTPMTLDVDGFSQVAFAGARVNILDARTGRPERQVFSQWFIDDGTLTGPAGAGTALMTVGVTDASGRTTYAAYAVSGPDADNKLTFTIARSGIADVEDFPSGTTISRDATAGEYGLIAAGISLIIIAVVTSGPDGLPPGFTMGI
jgi:hypothetical protein